MSRINIEDSLFKDPRYQELCIRVGCRHKALGMIVEAFILAQQYFLNEKTSRLIPVSEFNRRFCSGLLFECNLAELKNNGEYVYICGSNEQFQWLLQRKDAGKKGGRPKKVKPEVNRKKPEETGRLTEESGSNPLTLSLTPTLTHSHTQTTELTTSVQKTKGFVASYCLRFKAKYGINPQISGRDSGIAKRISNGLSMEKIDLYLDAYFAMPDAYLHKVKHPIALMESKMNEIVVFAGTGQFTTHKQTMQADDSVSNMMLLKQVREGKI